jgi:hypothetical protein
VTNAVEDLAAGGAAKDAGRSVRGRCGDSTIHCGMGRGGGRASHPVSDAPALSHSKKKGPFRRDEFFPRTRLVLKLISSPPLGSSPTSIRFVSSRWDRGWSRIAIKESGWSGRRICPHDAVPMAFAPGRLWDLTPPLASPVWFIP